MANYKIKLAVAAMIVSACMAAQPVAASAEEPETEIPKDTASHQEQGSAGKDETPAAEADDTAVAVAVIPETDVSEAEEETAGSEAAEAEKPAGVDTEEGAAGETTTKEDAVEEEISGDAAPEDEPAGDDPAEDDLSEGETAGEGTSDGEAAEGDPAEDEAADTVTTEEKTSEEDASDGETEEGGSAKEETAGDAAADEESAGQEVSEGKTEEADAAEGKAAGSVTTEETSAQETSKEGSAEGETAAEGTDAPADGEASAEGAEAPAEGLETLGEKSEEILAAKDAMLNTLAAPVTGEDGAALLAENETEDSGVYIKDKDGNVKGSSYASFDEAVDKAEDGDTIVLTKDAETKGLNISTNLTIQGNVVTDTVVKKDENGNDITEEVKRKTKLTFTQDGIALWGKNLTFKDMEVEMPGINSTAYPAEWNWMTICASKHSSLTLDNTDMVMDNENDKTPHYFERTDDNGNKYIETVYGQHAIYFCGDDQLNILNGSNLTIQNYVQDALEWDGGDGGYNVNIIDSTFTSDHNRSGFTGTFYATIDNSEVNVINSTGNGSNGSHFIITNDSKVNFSNNGSHGLSTGNLTVKDSTITAVGNGMTGIIINGTGKIADSDITITGTKGTSYWNAGLRLYTSDTTLDVKNSTLNIQGNEVSGIFCDANTKLTIDDASKVTVRYNNAAQKNCATEKELARKGGGLLIRSGATVTLGANTVINNNHALLAGDDVFMEAGGKLVLSKALGTLFDEACLKYDKDGNVTGGDPIDGWYIDAEGARWDFHGDQKHVINLDSDTAATEGVTIVKNSDGSYSITSGAGGFALKAAHAKLPEKPKDPTPDEPGTDDPATPVTPIVKPEDPKAPVVIEEIPAAPEVPEAPAEQISAEPQVKLPQTGQNWALAGLLGAMGTLLASAGFASGRHSRKRRKDEPKD